MEEIRGLNRGSFLLSASLSPTFNQFNFYTLNGIVIPASSTDFPKAQCWEHQFKGEKKPKKQARSARGG